MVNFLIKKITSRLQGGGDTPQPEPTTFLTGKDFESQHNLVFYSVTLFYSQEMRSKDATTKTKDFKIRFK